MKLTETWKEPKAIEPRRDEGLGAGLRVADAAAAQQTALPNRIWPRIAVGLAAGLIACFLAAGAHAQPHPQQYVTTVWQTEQGLSGNSVTALLQDHDGYLWIGTFSGLSRFDGETFRVLDPGSTPGFDNNNILALYQSRPGVVWIGTVAGGLFRLENGVATKYTDRNGLPSRLVTSIVGDARGGIWANTSQGVAHFDGAKWEAHPIHRGIPVRDFYLQARDGSMWFRSGADLVRFDADGSVATLRVRKPSAFLVQEARDGSVWVAIRDEYRLVRYSQGVFTDQPLPPLRQPEWLAKSPEYVLAMAENTHGHLLLLTPAGLVRVVGGKVSPPEPVSLPADAGDLPKVRTLLVDREGNLWVGMIGKGLVRLRPAPLTAYGKQEGLSDSSFSTVFQDREGRIWLGGDHLYWFDGHRFHRVPQAGDIRAIAQSGDGDLWFGGYGGLYRWRSGVLSHFKLEVSPVRSIYPDPDGTLWIGVPQEEHRGGLYRFHKEKLDQVPGVSGVQKLIVNRDGGFWAHANEGLFSVRGGEATLYEQGRNLPPLRVNVYQDTSGTLWFPTNGRGLFRFHPGRLHAITREDGLPSNELGEVWEDGKRYLWVGSNRGIFRLGLKELNDFAEGKVRSVLPVTYDLAEGMRSSECNDGNPGAWQTTDERIWFATTRGVVAIDPAAGSRLPPPVVLEEATANKVTLARDGRTSVPPGNDTFDFRFTALSLSAPRKVRFRYRLHPYEKDWVEAGNRQTAHYTNMAPGEYAFQVIAANGYGVWNDQGATLRFELQPHFYETRWFYSIVFAGIVLCAGGAYRLRIRQLRAREAQLEKLVDRRTEQLRAEIKVREAAESGLLQARSELEDRVRERTAQLAESEQRFRTFANHVADSLFVVDFEQGVVFDVNHKGCQSLGYTREELIGKSTQVFDVDVDRAALDAIVQRTEQGESVVDIHWHRRKDGSEFPVEVHTSLVLYDGRRFVLKLARDITDRLRAEKQRERLRQQEAELAHLNRVSMMGELAASIAHEVNQPLTGVVSNGSACLRWLAGEQPNLEEAREAAGRIVRDGKRAGDVIARIRALTRRAATPRERLDLNEIIREVLVLVGDKAGKGAVTIRTQFDHALAPVSGDRIQLQQVVLNLVMNAIEAMRGVLEDARDLLITTQNIDGDQVQVTVRDTGPGIDPDTIGKIFDPFYTTKPEGTGMGLSISRSIIESHGGLLWATAKDTPGSAFHFTLPKHHGASQEESASRV